MAEFIREAVIATANADGSAHLTPLGYRQRGELVLLALWFIGLASSTRVHQAAAALFLGGPYTAVFWVGVVGLGIAVPLFVQTLAVGHRVRHTAVAPLLVLAGGLLLRFVFVSAGQFSHWGPY